MNSPRLLTFVRKRLLFLAYASLAALILGELGRFYWLPELFSHFVPYYAVISCWPPYSARKQGKNASLD